MTLSKNNLENINSITIKYNKDMKPEEKKEVAKELVKLFLDSNLKINSKANKISLTKKYVSKKINDIDLIKNIIAPKEITKQTFETAAKKRMEKQIFEIKKETLQKIKSYKKSDDIYKMLIYLLFATGRRYSTIISGEFKKVKGKRGYMQAQLLKKRGELKNMFYEFPIIGRVSDILRLLKKFRQKFKLQKNSLALNRQANILIKVNLDNENLNLSKLRPLYSLYLYKTKNKNKTPINQFVSRVLCHSSDSTSIHYTGLNIV